MQRSVTPELLDSLPASHPDAIASRRDLRRIDRVMGNSRWLSARLQSASIAPGRCLELGAGEGQLARRLSQLPGVERYTALDLAPPPPSLPETIHWARTDLLTYEGYDAADTLIASLILHHLCAEALDRLGQALRRSGIRQILAAEPHRARRHQWLARAGRWIGFNHVTLHDAPASVAAGFRADELAEALGLGAAAWKIVISTTATGAYRMAATRR